MGCRNFIGTVIIANIQLYFADIVSVTGKSVVIKVKKFKYFRFQSNRSIHLIPIDDLQIIIQRNLPESFDLPGAEMRRQTSDQEDHDQDDQLATFLVSHDSKTLCIK